MRLSRTGGITLARVDPALSMAIVRRLRDAPLKGRPRAPVAELVDALDSKSSSARSAGSIPARGTTLRPSGFAWRVRPAKPLGEDGLTIPPQRGLRHLLTVTDQHLSGRAPIVVRAPATRSSPCRRRCIARTCRGFRRPGRPWRCHAGISGRGSLRASRRNHMTDRHRRRSCDERSGRTRDRRLYKPDRSIRLLLSAPYSPSAWFRLLPAEQMGQGRGKSGGHFRIVHANLDG